MSTVRRNLLAVVNYTPYCGNFNCRMGMARSVFNGSQFECRCGWKSSFEPEFIEKYKEAQEKLRHETV